MRLTALNKPDGGVRGIAIGCSLRRLVTRTWANQFCKVFEVECSPFQCVLSTRAGTVCVGHMLGAAMDANPTATILSVDGHVHRAANGADASSKGIAVICADVLRSAFR